MEYDLSIIIAHYKSNDDSNVNPLHKTLQSISNQCSNYKIEIIIADDGSNYTMNAIKDYSKCIDIDNDSRKFFILNNSKLSVFLNDINIKNNFISHWVYLPKHKKCMSKARVVNYAVKISKSKNILFLDDDNYLISKNSIENILLLLSNFNFIVGQIKDNNGRLRLYKSRRVQGTTLVVNKDIFFDVGGLGEWTEKFSCGIDSDFWIKLFNYHKSNNVLKACFTNKLSTYDSYSKRWKKYTTYFRDYYLKKEFNKIYKIKNYKNSKYNLSRVKDLWIKNLLNE